MEKYVVFEQFGTNAPFPCNEEEGGEVVKVFGSFEAAKEWAFSEGLQQPLILPLSHPYARGLIDDSGLTLPD